LVDKDYNRLVSEQTLAVP